MRALAQLDMLATESRWTEPAVCEVSLYRYLFGWVWAPGRPIVVYCGLNPSTMTAEKTDQTGRKWRGFAERGGFGGYIAVNTHAFRATDPDDLLDTMEAGIDIVGPENDAAIRAALAFPGVTEAVACWGNPPDRCLEPRLDATEKLLRNGPVPLSCWGLTGAGNPRHPLMLPYSTPRMRMLPEAIARSSVSTPKGGPR